MKKLPFCSLVMFSNAQASPTNRPRHPSSSKSCRVGLYGVFSPHRRWRLFSKVDIPDAKLRIRCEVKVLMRAIQERRIVLMEHEPFSYDGNIDLLKPILECLNDRTQSVMVKEFTGI